MQKKPFAWKVASGSVQGASHIRTSQPCQDAVEWSARDGCLLVVMADGAGSAIFSEIGAKLACKTALETLEREAKNVEAWGEDRWKACLGKAGEDARKAVVEEAEMAGNPLRGYASTIIIVAATSKQAAALQVGDGAVVIMDDAGQMRCLTAPLESEYLNETVFLSAENALETAQFKFTETPLKGVAALTDGLQLLALKMPGATPHAPFFQPLFRFTATENDQGVRNEKLAGLLRSPKISQRADDDLTLLLAVLEEPQ